MTKILISLIIIAGLLITYNTFSKKEIMNVSVYDFKARTIDGGEKSLGNYKGKVLLIVNVASKCGYTPQYEGLQQLYEKYGNKGLEILAFPCNQFGAQEPGSNDEIKQFCSLNYHVTFQLFDKIDVNGPNQHPLYKYLKSVQSGLITDDIKWNFTKFLVDRNGKPVDRFAPQTTPAGIEDKIKSLL